MMKVEGDLRERFRFRKSCQENKKSQDIYEGRREEDSKMNLGLATNVTNGHE